MGVTGTRVPIVEAVIAVSVKDVGMAGVAGRIGVAGVLGVAGETVTVVMVVTLAERRVGISEPCDFYIPSVLVCAKNESVP